ncbi:MAG TPA: hypothetical protein PKX92_02860 [Edaphocola sp.]|nr:hypothetical protein [Edaphocola sp.]
MTKKNAKKNVFHIGLEKPTTIKLYPQREVGKISAGIIERDL